MALTLSFPITIIAAVPTGSITQPIQGGTFTAVAPWGQSTAKPNIEEAINELLHRGGSQYSGAFYNYMSAQTLNGATGSGPTAFLSANQL